MNSPSLIPDLQSCILCDDVRQERSGKFILIGLFDAIMAQQVPVRYPRLCLVTRWCSGQGEFRQRTRILKPNQEDVVVEGREMVVRLPGPEATATNIEILGNVSFEEQGTHWVEILLDGDLKLRYPLLVRQLPGRAASGTGTDEAPDAGPV